VSGRVQGVFYRASTQQEAERLNLRGVATNLPDGTVEVIACGDEESLSNLEAWLWDGSRWSEVADVVCEEIEKDIGNSFLVR